MKRMIILGIIWLAPNLYSEHKPNADVYVRITDDLPKLRTGIMLWYNGIFSVTNVGEVAFTVVTDEEWSGEVVRFYREGNEEQQRIEEVRGEEKRRKEQERKEAVNDYYFCIEKEKASKTLQPGENITFESKFFFRLPPGTSGDIYKAEMYLGNDTWIPVHITPTLGTLKGVSFDRDRKLGDFYYSQEGTNQWLYVKTDDGKFKRVSEMKLGSKPEKEKDENTVTFEALDGTRKKLTREQARQIINEAGN